MILPLLTLPFITLAFWAMGGGKGDSTGVQPDKQMGLNLQLPAPHLEDGIRDDKLSFYNKAQEDSIKLRLEMQNDPYYKKGLDKLKIAETIGGNAVEPSGISNLNTSPYYPKGAISDHEAQIYERLDAINTAIQSPSVKSNNNLSRQYSNLQLDNSEFSTDVSRLENMMQVMNEPDHEDPEMKQLGTMLDKILDIQHPERVKDRVIQKSIDQKRQVFSVNFSEKEIPITYLGKENTIEEAFHQSPENRFYGTSKVNDASQELNGISAVIHQTQTVTTGSTIKLRLLTDVFINGNLIKQGSFVFGTTSLRDERLLIDIAGVRYGNNLLPVSLSVYDMDGLAGVYIPGSLSRDAAKQSADQSLQQIQMMSLDPSLKVQAASAGIQAAKGLLSKKIKLVKVTVKAGYQILLRDDNAQEY